jgi:hypothetical protein
VNAKAMRCACYLLLALWLPALAFADAPPVLECHGSGSAKGHNLRFAVTIAGLEGNRVVADDIENGESCSCKFRHNNLFDQSPKSMLPRGLHRYVTVHLKYQSCDAGCSRAMKKRIKANISVRHQLNWKGPDARSLRSYATPFAGGQSTNCDLFTMDLRALRQIEIERIDAMDETPEFKERLKGLKGLLDEPE